MAKHFLEVHNSRAGIHGANVDIGDRLLSEVYGKPFQSAIRDAHLRGVMPCYCSIGGLPIHASKQYLTDLLRTEMGFDGVVVSDYGAVENVYQVQHVGESKGEAGLRCMKAGMDMELPMPSCYGEEIKACFAEGKEDMAVVDRAVLRILEAKFRMGLFENPYALKGEELKKAVHHDGDDEVSKQAAQESLILLKNNGALPLTLIEIGASSRDIRLCKEVTVTGTFEKPVFYTKQSTVGELMKTKQGRSFIEQMMNRGGGTEKSKSDNVKNMGEGSDKIVESMMVEMPLQSIVTFGRMTEKQLDDLLQKLNADFPGISQV